MQDLLEPGNLVGFLAAGLMLASFAMRTMLPLRLVAIAGNLAFIAYGLMQGLTPVIALHALLLPLNIWRAVEIANVSRRIRRARHYGFDTAALLPLMRRDRFAPGHVLFRKGDPSDRLYVIVSGSVRILEQDVTIGPGSLFGEIGLFVKGGMRTSSAACAEACELASLSSEEVERLYFQNPEFGFALISLLATRLNDNMERLRARLGS